MNKQQKLLGPCTRPDCHLRPRTCRHGSPGPVPVSIRIASSTVTAGDPLPAGQGDTCPPGKREQDEGTSDRQWLQVRDRHLLISKTFPSFSFCVVTTMTLRVSQTLPWHVEGITSRAASLTSTMAPWEGGLPQQQTPWASSTFVCIREKSIASAPSLRALKESVCVCV